MIATALRISVALWLVAALCATGDGALPSSSSNDATPVQIPLSVTHNAKYGTYKVSLSLGISNVKPLPIVFDTGSTGLRVFADANLEASGSGVQCSQIPTSVTYGNPGGITFSGVICYAFLHFENFSTPELVPIAYLTSASCPKTNPNCKIPDMHNPKAMGGYGVFGAGLTGVMSGKGKIPNPILTLPGRLGSVYSILLTHESGELVLGSREPENSGRFQLTPGTSAGERWTFAHACLFVDRRTINDCLAISFDTGNGVPWIHNADANSIPHENGIVKPGSLIGFAPQGDSTETATLHAGSSFADSIKVIETPSGTPLINVSLQPFFDRIVTYDNTGGAIIFAPSSVAPTNTHL